MTKKSSPRTELLIITNLVKISNSVFGICKSLKNYKISLIIGLNGELYLVKRDGGQQRLILKQGRAGVEQGQLLEIKKVVEFQLKEAENQKAKAWAVYR